MYSKDLFYIPSPIGDLKLVLQGEKLISLSIMDALKTKQEKKRHTLEHPVSKNIISLLDDFFTSATSFPKVALCAQGTDFQKIVWHELRKIPLGETRTYGDIAKIISSSPRAVGNACRNNPIHIIIPCHRVVSAKGMGGYAGETEGKQLNIKRWLLKHEGVCL